MIASLPWVRLTTTWRDSTVESSFTTKTNWLPCCPLWTACDGTTMLSGSTVSVSSTLANWPGHRRRSSLPKVAFSRIVPVVWSTALSTKVTTPRSGCGSPAGKARTSSGPAAM